MLTGEQVKQYRELRNYTQTYVAGRLGVSQSVYSKIETGKSRIFGKRAKQIAVILEITDGGAVREGTTFSPHPKESQVMMNESFAYELKDEVLKLRKEINDLKKFIRDLYGVASEINMHNRKL